MRNKFLVIVGLLSVCFASCSPFDEAHKMDIEELAWNPDSVFVVSAEGGKLTIPVYSNGHVTISPMGDSDWAELSTTALEADGKLEVTMDRNLGRRRMLRLIMSLEGTELKDTIELKQEGFTAFLGADSPYAAVSGQESEEVKFNINTNLPAEDIDHAVEYLMGTAGWLDTLIVTDYSPSLSFLNTASRPNDTDEVRKAKITLSHIDGWGDTCKCNFYVTQARMNGEFGSAVDFAAVRKLGTPEGYPIAENLILDGVVVSDYRSRNMDENTNISYDVVDSLSALSTAYLVSEDGTLGFRLKFVSANENVLQQGTKLQLNLYGTVVTREDNPQRYTISNVTGENMVGSVSGSSADIPVKVKTIGALTEEDVYTYVSLQNTEFIFKYGTYADVYENYTLASSISKVNSGNNDRMDGWATLLVDAEGASIYAPVNMHCLWRRSGNGVPQGVGPTSGIIVHNKLPKVGNAGKYQIRVVDESGFGQSETGSSYEEYCVWNGEGKYGNEFADYGKKNERYAYKKNETIVPSNDILTSSSDVARGELYLENQVQRGGGDNPLRSADYYCSPTASNLGVSDQYSALCAVMDVKGWYQWDNDEVVGYNGFRYEINTKGLTGSGMLFTYDFAAGTVSITYSKAFPAHWCVEYSIDGGYTYTKVNDYVSGNSYVHLRSLPWWDATMNGTLYKTCAAAGLGFSQHAVLLPQSVLGLERLLVRLRPDDNTITTLPIIWDGDSETAEIQYSTSSANYIKIGSAKFSVKK